MRLIIAGGRNYILSKENYDYLDNLLTKYDITEVVRGTCSGADKCGEGWAQARNIPIKQFPANWKLYGKRAGAMRNKEMVEYASSEEDSLMRESSSCVMPSTSGILVAFPGGAGTAITVQLAKKANLLIFLPERK